MLLRNTGNISRRIGDRTIGRAIGNRIIGRYGRGYSQYNYYQQYKPPTSKFKKFTYVVVGMTAFTGAAYYLLWPRHTFPSLVAQLLRKGLWAESDKGEMDFQLALKYYVEALEECNTLKVDKLSDEYTGIQLKVGEMFERLNMVEDATMIYNEIATLYLSVLTDRGSIMNQVLRRHLIQKDLRIALKLAQLNLNNPHLVKALLITHLIIAQDEIKTNIGGVSINDFLAKATAPTNVTLSGTDVVSDSIPGQVPGDGEAVSLLSIKKMPEIWEPFSDEFFNAMDMLSTTCLLTGDLPLATQIQISSIQSMILADIDPSKVLLSQCNLGSLLYFQAEQYEAKEIQFMKKYPNFNEDEQDVEIPDHEKKEYLESKTGKEKSMNLSIGVYESVLDYSKKSLSTIAKEDASAQKSLAEISALATYGLGVLHLHLSDYEKSERFLRESRVRAKSSGYEEILVDIERELAKLFKEKKLLKEGGTITNDPTEKLELDIHIKGSSPI